MNQSPVVNAVQASEDWDVYTAPVKLAEAAALDVAVEIESEIESEKP